MSAFLEHTRENGLRRGTKIMVTVPQYGNTIVDDEVAQHHQPWVYEQWLKSADPRTIEALGEAALKLCSTSQQG